jgi:hypothetical protein
VSGGERVGGGAGVSSGTLRSFAGGRRCLRGEKLGFLREVGSEWAMQQGKRAHGHGRFLPRAGLLPDPLNIFNVLSLSSPPLLTL